MRRWLGLVLPWLALCVACSGPPSEDSPSGALRLFVESIERARLSAGSDRDEALESAYRLLDETSRERLEERSRTAEALGARDHDAFEMLAAYPSREAASAVPTRASSFRESVDPDGLHATVSVRLPESTIEVPMVREGEAWRVVLSVPEPSREDR